MTHVDPSGPTEPATGRLAALADEYWQDRLRFDPIEATLLGDRRFDAELPDPSAEANRVAIRRLEALAARVRKEVPRDSAVARVTHAALLGEIENELAARACFASEWAVDPRDGPHVTFQTLAQLTGIAGPRDAAAMLARWRKIPAYLDGRIANLRAAKAAGRIATRGSVTRVLTQLDQLLAQSAHDSVLAEPARKARGVVPGVPGTTSSSISTWDAAAREAFAEKLIEIVDRDVKPAFARYRDAIKTEILPASRDDANGGLDKLPGGAECYRRMIFVHTSMRLSPDEIHEIGLSEIARIRAEMIELGGKLFGTRDLSAIQKRLRTDPSLAFATRQQVEDKAREALGRAEVAMPKWFGRIAKTPCEVVRVEAFEEKDTTIAYYRQPAIDGSRPGRYYINTYAPETRPRYEAEALAFHESVPGHHTQIALAMEAVDVPEFRKHLGVTAYVEGWALYTERLADEMGLYSADLDRMGMLSFDAWRASRLVVDTGLHAKGWSRKTAIDYMLANTALAQNNIENEVDRYLGWPGQALAYKLGQREIFSLRREAEQRLGSRFDIRGFHDEVLRHGAVSLAVLRAEIERWIAGLAAPR